MLKKGKITEVGNHDSLLKEHPDGVYAKLVRQQEDADHNDKKDSSSSDNERLNADDDDYKTDQSIHEHNANTINPSMYATGKQRSTVKDNDLDGSPVNEKSMLLEHNLEIEQVKKQQSRKESHIENLSSEANFNK